MSWITPTALFVIGSLAIAFGFSEWFVARRRSRRGGADDPAQE
jgi:hypothetical protein